MQALDVIASRLVAPVSQFHRQHYVITSGLHSDIARPQIEKELLRYGFCGVEINFTRLERLPGTSATVFFSIGFLSGNVFTFVSDSGAPKDVVNILCNETVVKMGCGLRNAVKALRKRNLLPQPGRKLFDVNNVTPPADVLTRVANGPPLAGAKDVVLRGLPKACAYFLREKRPVVYAVVTRGRELIQLLEVDKQPFSTKTVQHMPIEARLYLGTAPIWNLMCGLTAVHNLLSYPCNAPSEDCYAHSVRRQFELTADPCSHC